MLNARKKHHFGILEDLKHYPDGDVPGSALLDDHDTGAVPDAVVSHLKKGSGRFSHIVLQPQPSDDPRDPLNWPTWKKEGLFWVLTYMSGLVGAIGPLISTGYATLAPQLGVSETALVTATNSDLILALGCIMLFFSPLAHKVGRRPCYLLGAVFLFAGSLAAGATTSFNGLKVSRIFQGFGMAPFEALVVSTIGGIYVTPIINGKIIDTAGYKVCFWIIAGCFGLGLVGIFFFVPETVYDRPDVFDTDSGHSLEGASAVNAATEDLEKNTDKPVIQHLEDGSPSGSPSVQTYAPPKTFVRELLPYSGYWGRDSFLKLCLRPFPYFLSPVVLFGFFTYGLPTCWGVILSVLSSIIFASTYEFNATSTGLTSIGSLIAAVIATLIAGPAVDWAAVYFARRNHGRFEPEFRLYLLLPSMLLSVFGFMGWALMVKAGNVPWIGPVIMMAVIGSGGVIGSTASIAYVIDTHRKHTPEAVAVINLAKNLCLYGLSSIAVEWITAMGIPSTFGLLGGLTALCYMTAIPMYIYGKRARSLIARHEKFFMSVDEKF